MSKFANADRITDGETGRKLQVMLQQRPSKTANSERRRLSGHEPEGLQNVSEVLEEVYNELLYL